MITNERKCFQNKLPNENKMFFWNESFQRRDQNRCHKTSHVKLSDSLQIIFNSLKIPEILQKSDFNLSLFLCGGGSETNTL